MPKGIKKGAGAAAAGATSDLFKDDPPAPSAQASTDFSDGFSEQAKDYIIAQKLDEPSDTGKAASTFQQLSVEQQREIKRATVRYIVMKALSGDGLIRAKELHTAIMLPGKYATDTKAITALYLVSVAAPVLERVFGIGVSTARKTLDMSASGRRRCGGGRVGWEGGSATGVEQPSGGGCGGGGGGIE